MKKCNYSEAVPNSYKEIIKQQSAERRLDRRLYGSGEYNRNGNDLGNCKRCKYGGDGDISAIIRGFTHIFMYLYL